MKLNELMEKRGRAIQSMREITEKPANGGDLSDEQNAKFDQLKGELRSLDAAIERQKLIDEADRQTQGEKLTTTGDDRLDTELRNFSLVRAMAAQVPELAGNVDNGRERELSAELARRSNRKPDGFMVPMAVFERRVLTSTAPAGGPGSNIISTDHLGGQFIDLLRDALQVRRLGARVLNGLVGNIDIPKLKTSATVGWVAENAALSAADQQFSKVSMTPKHAGALTEFSRNMLLQSSPDIEDLVRADFAEVLARAIEKVAIQGGGSNEPTGILQTAGIGSVAIGTDGGALTWDDVIDLIAEVEIDNAMGSAFLTNSKVLKSARKILKVAGDAGAGFIMDSAQINSMAGYPVAGTNLVPSNLTKGTGTSLSALLFGNFGDLILGYWSAFDLLVNPYESTAYSKGNVQVRAMLTADVAVRHPESFAAITDLTTA